LLSWLQIFILGIWMVLTVILVNYGGTRRSQYMPVILSGYFLAIIGCATAGLLQLFGVPANAAFTSAASNFALVLSAAVGANYIAHAKMNLSPERRWWI